MSIVENMKSEPLIDRIEREIHRALEKGRIIDLLIVDGNTWSMLQGSMEERLKKYVREIKIIKMQQNGFEFQMHTVGQTIKMNNSIQYIIDADNL